MAFAARWLAQSPARALQRAANSDRAVLTDQECLPHSPELAVHAADLFRQVVRSVEVEFRLERQGPVKIFTFYNQEITAGPEKGTKVEGSRSYIYRLTDDTFDEVWGFLPDQDPASDELTLIAELGTPVIGDTVISASMEALRQ